MLKKIIRIFLILICIASISLVFLGATTKANIENICLKVEDCNIKIIISDDTNFKYDYDKSKFEVNIKVDSLTNNITVKLKSNAKTSLTDMVIIYIPNKDYKLFSLDSKSSGVKIPKLNSNIDVVSDKGSVSIDIPKDFKKAVNCNLKKSSGSITFAKDTLDYTLKIEISNSSIKLDEKFTPYENGSKNYE